MVSGSEPWVLVAGGFHQHGGMDKANYALASLLASRGHPVHLVSHDVDPCLTSHPRITITQVDRPAGSFFLGDWMLGAPFYRSYCVAHDVGGARVGVSKQLGNSAAFATLNLVLIALMAMVVNGMRM